MPILTKNQTPTKGQKAQFQLDKAALAALPSVAANTYFSDVANWKQVDLIYKSDIGSQKKIVKFDAAQAAPIGYFFASDVARDTFEIQYIMINDFDGGEFRVNRGELQVSEFDVYMIAPPLSGFTWGQIGGGIFNNTSTRVELVSGGSGGYNSGAYSVETLSLTSDGSVTFTYDFSGDTGTPYGPIGFSDSTSGGAGPIDYGIFATGTSVQIALNNTWGAPQPNILALTQPAIYGVTTFKVAIESGNFVLYQDGVKRDERTVSSVPSATNPMRFWMNFAGQTGQIVTIIDKTGSWV